MPYLSSGNHLFRFFKGFLELLRPPDCGPIQIEIGIWHHKALPFEHISHLQPSEAHSHEIDFGQQNTYESIKETLLISMYAGIIT